MIMKKFEFTVLTDNLEVARRYHDVVEALQREFNVHYVVNWDIKALSSYFSDLGEDFHSYKKIVHEYHESGYLPQVYANGMKKILAISFKDITDYFDPSFHCVKGMNQEAMPEHHEKGTYYDRDLKMIYWHDKAQESRLKEYYQNMLVERKEWAEFEEIKPKMSTERLGEAFPIGATVADYFLNCLPPIYGKGCFLVSEAYSHTAQGEAVYYCIRGYNWGKDCSPTVEFNTVKNCK